MNAVTGSIANGAGDSTRAEIMASIESLALAVRRGDWQAAEASDQALRDGVLRLAASVDEGKVSPDRARETLTVVRNQHLEALEQARVAANTLRERLRRIGVGKRANDAYSNHAADELRVLPL